jgi:hypothetical protein
MLLSNPVWTMFLVAVKYCIFNELQLVKIIKEYDTSNKLTNILHLLLKYVAPKYLDLKAHNLTTAEKNNKILSYCKR